MAIIKNPDGTFTVTTPDGQIISGNVPPSLISSQPAVPEPVPVASPDQPPPEPVPVATGTPSAVPLATPPTLFNEPAGAPPPTAMESGQAVAENAPAAHAIDNGDGTFTLTNPQGIPIGKVPAGDPRIPAKPSGSSSIFGGGTVKYAGGPPPGLTTFAPGEATIPGTEKSVSSPVPGAAPTPKIIPVGGTPTQPQTVNVPEVPVVGTSTPTYSTEAAIAGNQVIVPVGGGGYRRVPEQLVPKGGVLSQVKQMPVYSPEEQMRMAELEQQAAQQQAILNKTDKYKNVYYEPREIAKQKLTDIQSELNTIKTTPKAKLQEEMTFQNLIDTYIVNAAEKKAAYADAAAEFGKQKQIADAKIADIAKQQREREAQLKPRLDDLMKRQEELSTMKVDPERYWNNKSAFSKVVAVIGMALGGWEAGLRGGPNKVYDMIHNSINEDIAAQKSNIETKKAEADISSNVLAQMQRMWMSPEAAEAATRALMIESAAAEAAKQGANMQGVSAKENADALVAMLRHDRQQQNNAAGQAEAGVLQTQSALVPAHVEGGGGVNVRSVLKKNLALYKEMYPDDSDKARQEAVRATSFEVSLRTGRTFGVEEEPATPEGEVKLTKKQKQDIEVNKQKMEAMYPGGGGRYGSMAQAQLQKDTQKAAGDLTKISRQLENYRQEMYNFLDYRNNPLKIAQHPMDTLKSIDYAKTASKEAAGQFMNSFMGKTDQGWKISKSLTDGPSVFARKTEVDAAVDEGINRAVDVYLGMRRAAGMPKMTKEQVLAGEFPEGIKEKEAGPPEVPGATSVGGGSEE